MHADHERAAAVGEVPGRQRPERAVRDHVAFWDAQGCLRVAEEVGPVDGDQLPVPGRGPGHCRQRAAAVNPARLAAEYTLVGSVFLGLQ